MNESRMKRIARSVEAASVHDLDEDVQNAFEEVDRHLDDMVVAIRSVYYNDGQDVYFAPEDIDKASEIAAKAKLAAEDTGETGLVRSIARMEAMLNTLAREGRAQLKIMGEARKRYQQFLKGWTIASKGIEADARAAKQVR